MYEILDEESFECEGHEILAQTFANQVHKIQKDKVGESYIGHIYRVVEGVKHTSCSAVIVAYLHDTIEDGTVGNEETFVMENFPPSIVAAVQAISHHDNEPYLDYIDRVSNNAIATIVKCSDLMDNLDWRRWSRNPKAREENPDQFKRWHDILVPRMINALNFLSERG